MNKSQKQLNRQIDELNGVIHRRNLYANGRRYIYAHEVQGTLCVQDLYTEKSVAVSSLGKLFDGYGQEIVLSTPEPTKPTPLTIELVQGNERIKFGVRWKDSTLPR